MPPRGRLKALRRTGGAVARLGLGLLHSAAEGIPAPAGPVVKAATGGLRGLVTSSDVCKANKAAATRARLDGEEVAQWLLDYLERPNIPHALIPKLNRRLEDLDRLASQIPDIAALSRAERVLHAEDHKLAISGAVEEIRRLERAAHRDIVLHRGESPPRLIESTESSSKAGVRKFSLTLPPILRGYPIIVVSSILFRY
ncbi:hypothetical protein EXIGLDRAFT_718609 [Exidia glandulosa HHB12029]|uniref:Uncharacterized protein n=1 Tax=Exidia glandulosa HHB12029 TaxID=1314781 RepID=A0A165HNC6_EXIGL|nr:hypothetical protein EXIGLDRAFT_718609 [Exidia glandulosa HHB12029]